MCYALSFEATKLRLWIQPESTHNSWNDVRNSIRRSGLQHTVLLSTVLSNCAHGPYRSGANKRSFQEAAIHLSENISLESFQQLVDSMAMDMGLDSDDPILPQEFEQIPEQPAIATFPVFDS